MHAARRQALSFAGLLTTLVAAPALMGCGAAAAPVAAAPAHGETVVDVTPVAPVKPPPAKGGADSADPHAAISKVQRDAEEFGMIRLLPEDGSGDEPTGHKFKGDEGTMGGVAGGVVGGVPGGVIGGLGTGTGTIGGLGLGGGSGGGGGASFGVIGLLGNGSGLGSIGYGSRSSGDLVSGTAINSDGRTVIEYGDSTALGVSLEAATRALRDKLYKLRGCYRDALAADARAAGTFTLRLVVKQDGYIAYSGIASTTLLRPDTQKCVREAFLQAYVGVPPSGQIGVIETAVSFRPAK